MLKFTVNTNESKDKVPESFTGDLTQHLPKALDKPAQYLAIQISPDQGMSFSGSTDPCAMCFPYSVGKTGEQNKVYSKLLCDLLNKQQKIPSDRIYVSLFNNSAGKCKLEQHLHLRCPWVVMAYSGILTVV